MIETTFIIPSVGRDTLKRAIESAKAAGGKVLYELDKDKEGPGAVRNRLIAKAETEWISFLDDDDTVTPDYVTKLDNEVRMSPHASLIFFREFFLNGTVIPMKPEIVWGNIGISFSVKKDVAMEFPFRQIRYEDLDFVQRVSEKHLVSFSPFITYKERHQ